jgi:hypothetical protein
MNKMAPFKLEHPPQSWKRLGLIVDRGAPGEFDSSVTGDPCIVWDPERDSWHMFYFAQKHVEGREVNCNAHAVSTDKHNLGPGNWKKQGPVSYTNPEALCGDAHKPWILMDPFRPNIAAKIDGEYWLFTVTWRGPNKVIQLATSANLDGPWTVEPQPIIDLGSEDAHDGYHADTVTAYYFAERDEILIFYKSYPLRPQGNHPHSPYGNGSAAAIMNPTERRARKLGRILNPSPDPEHWTAGWIGGLQILPAANGGWYGLMNASPTPPASVDEEPEMREPAPSLGGWAYTPETWPIKGWQAADAPIEWIEDVPAAAVKAGEGVNLWRHHLTILPGGDLYLYYNTGPYGQERMFARHACLEI